MALSNSFDYTDSVTAADIIALALRRLGVYDPDETINSTEQTNALQVLNLLVKEWSLKGVDVVGTRTGYLFLTHKGVTPKYALDSDYFASSHNTTTTTAAGAVGASTITVTSITGIATTDVIIIQNSDGTLFQTTVNGAPSGSTVTLTATLTKAVNSGAYVYSFPTTSRYIGPVIDLVHAMSLTSTSDTVTHNEGGLGRELGLLGDQEYQRYSNKMQTGIPTGIYYRVRSTDSELYIWPMGDRTADRLVLTFTFYQDDLDGTTNNLYLPAGMHNAIAWQLAAEMAPEYGLSASEQMKLFQIGDRKFNETLDGLYNGMSTTFEAEFIPRR